MDSIHIICVMDVFHHATNRALRPLPDDLAPLVQAFLLPTRLDWRTCRKHEADLIRKPPLIVATDWIFDFLIIFVCLILYLTN